MYSILSVCLSEHHLYADAHGDQKKALNNSLGLELGGVMWVLRIELNLGPLEEYLELLTVEPSPQSQISYIQIIN